MREITTHHDGHGLNERLRIVADDPDPNAGGASHHYAVYYKTSGSGPGPFEIDVAEVDFQYGPRDVKGSRPGITEGVLYAILMDRLSQFQKGPYPHAENAKQLDLLYQAMESTKRRADERAKRGVLGTNQV